MSFLRYILPLGSLVVYILIISYTDYSFIGFWSDLAAFFILILLILFATFNRTLYSSIKVTFTIIAATALVLFFYNPFILDYLKLKSFLFQQVDGRLFNSYFKPVGAYSGGYGNFWISEVPKYFPIIEKRIHFNRTFHHNFNDDYFDGEPVDNYEVSKSYIKDIINN